MKLISIIVPVFNKGLYLEKCIKSILQQAYSHFEIILIDDGSNDNSRELCMKLAATDNRIRFFYQQNLGVSAARNRGIEHAYGEYIGFVDADDCIHPLMYQTLIESAEMYKADISACKMQIVTTAFNESFFHDLQSYDKIVMTRDIALTVFLNERLESSANNKIYRKEILKNIAFEGSINEDVLFTFQAVLSAQITVMNEVNLYYYIKREGTVSTSKLTLNQCTRILDVSKSIIDLVKLKAPLLETHAKIFDITQQISILNLQLLSPYPKTELYFNIVKKLKEYKPFIGTVIKVRRKHIIALNLFWHFPKLYRLLLYNYGKVTNADFLKRI